MLKFLLIPLLLATAEYDEAPMKPLFSLAPIIPTTKVPTAQPKSPSKGPPGPKNIPPANPKNPTTEPSAYAEGPPKSPPNSKVDGPKKEVTPKVPAMGTSSHYPESPKTAPKGPSKTNDAYAQGPPNKTPKMSKAPRVQNQQPQLIGIFLGIGEIICGATGRCQPRNPCPQNTVFRQSCPCEPSCDNQNPPCDSQCARPRCQCASGLVRDPNGNCVTPSNCPTLPSCPGGQVFMNGGCPCEGTCDNPNPQCTWQCYQQSRCQCAQGTVRNAQGQCVSPSNCFSNTCPAGQVFMNRGCPCEGTCSNPNPQCTWECWQQSRCQCAQGTVRNAQGRCVSPNSCTTTCRANQYFNTCPPPVGCEPSCQNYSPNCNWFACTGARCTCRPGYYRQSSARNARCVSWQQCWQWGGSRTFPGRPRDDQQEGQPWQWWTRD